MKLRPPSIFTGTAGVRVVSLLVMGSLATGTASATSIGELLRNGATSSITELRSSGVSLFVGFFGVSGMSPSGATGSGLSGSLEAGISLPTFSTDALGLFGVSEFGPIVSGSIVSSLLSSSEVVLDLPDGFAGVVTSSSVCSFGSVELFWICELPWLLIAVSDAFSPVKLNVIMTPIRIKAEMHENETRSFLCFSVAEVSVQSDKDFWLKESLESTTD